MAPWALMEYDKLSPIWLALVGPTIWVDSSDGFAGEDPSYWEKVETDISPPAARGSTHLANHILRAITSLKTSLVKYFCVRRDMCGYWYPGNIVASIVWMMVPIVMAWNVTSCLNFPSSNRRETGRRSPIIPQLGVDLHAPCSCYRAQ